jgi:hypothetical protein
MSDWLAILKAAIAAEPRGISGVAQRLGYSRPAVSRVLAGSYGNTERLAAAVLATFARIDCPHLGASLAPDECRAYATRSYSAISAADVPHWRACKKCPHKPEES